MKILQLFSLLLLKLVCVRLTSIEEVKHELHEKHKKIDDIYTDLINQLVEDNDENEKDVLYVHRKIKARLEMELNENETADLILTKYKEINSDKLITAKICELSCVKNELRNFVTLHFDHSSSPYPYFTDELKAQDLSENFNYCLNKYFKDHCGIDNIYVKSKLHILKRLRFAVEEQISRLEYLRVKICELKGNENKGMVSNETNTNPNKAIIEIQLK